MKVGILTRSRSYNYGAVLQAYALKESVGLLGHEGRVVDFWTPADVRGARSPFYRGFKPQSLAQNALILAHYVRWRRRRARFDKFRRERLNLTERRYLSHQELLASPPPCEVFICGSDQVWNPRAGVNPVYFLRFAKELGARRIAYAPSFNVPDVPEDCRQRLAEFIADIPFLSTREERGREIINELTGREAKVVLDPVLLLSSEQWKARVPDREPAPRPYVLVYALRARQTLAKLVAHLREKTRLDVVLVTGESPASRLGIRADRVVWDAGPEEFLRWTMGAACVATNSFHGTAFAIVFRKPLYVVPHTAGDSRMTNLMDRVGMSRYLVQSDDDPLADDPLAVSYDSAGPALEALRQESLGYLQNALGSAAG